MMPSTSHRGEHRDALGLVRRIAEHAIARLVHAPHEVGVEVLMVRVERDALEPAEALPPVGGNVVDQERPRQRGRGIARRVEGRLRERRQERRHLRIAPQRGGVERDRRAGLAFAAGHRLDLDVAEDAVGARPAGDRGQRGQRLAGILRGMPAPGVEPRQFAPRQRVGAPATARRPLERRIVQQEGQVVGRELHVELDHAVAVRVADPHGGQRVLGRELAGAAMRDEPRVRPIPRDIGGHRRTAPASPAARGVSGACFTIYSSSDPGHPPTQ